MKPARTVTLLLASDPELPPDLELPALLEDPEHPVELLEPPLAHKRIIVDSVVLLPLQTSFVVFHVLMNGV